jgi:hypothetical protein
LATVSRLNFFDEIFFSKLLQLDSRSSIFSAKKSSAENVTDQQRVALERRLGRVGAVERARPTEDPLQLLVADAGRRQPRDRPAPPVIPNLEDAVHISLESAEEISNDEVFLLSTFFTSLDFFPPFLRKKDKCCHLSLSIKN